MLNWRFWLSGPLPSEWGRRLTASSGFVLLVLVDALLWKQSDGTAPLNFASAFGIAWLARHRWRRWPLTLVFSALVLVLVLALTTTCSPRTCLPDVLASLLTMLAGGVLLRRTRAHLRMMSGPISFARLVILGCLAPPLVGAAVVGSATALSGLDALQDRAAFALGSMTGATSSLPLFLTILRWRRIRDWRISLDKDLALLAIGVLGVSLLALMRLHSAHVYIAAALTFVAASAGFASVAALAAAATLLASLLVAAGLMPHPPPESLLDFMPLQLPLIFAVVPAMLLSVMMNRSGRRSRQALAQSRSHYRRLYQKAPVMMLSLSAQLRVDSVSNFFLLKTGFQRAALLGRPFLDVIPQAQRDSVSASLQAMLRRPGNGCELELSVLRADGSSMLTHLMAVGEGGQAANATGLLLSLDDLTERRRLERLLAQEQQSRLSAAQSDAQRMRHLAQHDPLTGLPNRLLFEDRLQQGLRSPRGNLQRLGLIFVDLDRFKLINDTHGHAIGDALLCEVARRLSANIRQSDTVARIGGDEFVVMLPGIEGTEAAAEAAGKLMRAVSAPYQLGDLVLQVGFSAGIAIAPDDGNTPQELLRNADAAMYLAKHQGRGQVMSHRHPMASSDAQRAAALSAPRRRQEALQGD